MKPQVEEPFTPSSLLKQELGTDNFQRAMFEIYEDVELFQKFKAVILDRGLIPAEIEHNQIVDMIFKLDPSTNSTVLVALLVDSEGRGKFATFEVDKDQHLLFNIQPKDSESES